MYTEMALTARKFALTLAVTGIATMGSIALAPSASAAPAPAAQVVQDGPGTVIEWGHGNGPDEFLLGDHGRKPIFLCDADEPKKHAKKCKDLAGPTRF